MKKMWILGLLPLVLLTGCRTEETMEYVEDVYVQPGLPAPRQVAVQLPEDAAIPVLETESQQIYLCENYEITLENLSGGDLTETIRHISGYDREALSVIKTRQKDADRYEFVWTSAGEQGDRLGRAVILDDGNYHYCLSILRDTTVQGETQETWEDVFSSFSLTEGFIRID